MTDLTLTGAASGRAATDHAVTQSFAGVSVARTAASGLYKAACVALSCRAHGGPSDVAERGLPHFTA